MSYEMSNAPLPPISGFQPVQRPPSSPVPSLASPPPYQKPANDTSAVAPTAPSEPPTIKIATWNGKLEGLPTLINQLEAWIYFHPSAFRDDAEKILWAVTWLEGFAAKEARAWTEKFILASERARYDAESARGMVIGRSAGEARGCRNWREFVDVGMPEIAERMRVWEQENLEYAKDKDRQVVWANQLAALFFFSSVVLGCLAFFFFATGIGRWY